MGLPGASVRDFHHNHYNGSVDLFGAVRLKNQRRVIDVKNMCRRILYGEGQPSSSSGNSGGMDMMVEGHAVRHMLK